MHRANPSFVARRFALLELGFRPFYLLAAAFAVIAIAVWLDVLQGASWGGEFVPLAWHQHEMVFGFALAVITGFTLTAGRVWTGLETLRGVPLAMLGVHWLAARALMYAGPPLAAAIVDTAFPFVVAAVMGRVLLRSADRHNLFVCGFFVAAGLADAAFFLEQSGLLQVERGKPVLAALYLIVVLVTLIGGRVIPSFTASALRGTRVTSSRRADAWALSLTVACFTAVLAGLASWCVAPLAAGAGAAHLVRQSRWAPFATFRTPLLWIMHLSYAWIAVALFLLALESSGWLWGAGSTHAFGTGAMGGMVIAMMTRTALGHTGRALRAGTPEVAAYVLVHAGALLRLLATLPSPLGDLRVMLLGWSGIAWAAAFGVYFAVYLPRLLRPRVDGKPG